MPTGSAGFTAMTRSVLVTGGAGFIGSCLVQQLHQQGYDIHVIDPLAGPSLFPSGVTCHKASILDAPALNAAMRGRDQVFHLAACAGLWAADPQIFDRLNHQGTKAVIVAAANADVSRLIVTSTALVLQGWDDPDPGPVSEATARPALQAMAGPYSRSKWLADDAIRRAVGQGMDIVTLYPTVPIGPPDRFVTPPTEMLKQFLLKPPPFYLNMTLNLLHVEDAAHGIMLAAMHAPSQSRIILAGDILSFREFLQIIERKAKRPMPRRTVPWHMAALAAHIGEAAARITGKPPAASVEGVRVARHKRLYDTTYAQSVLGWSCRPASAALEETLASMPGL